MRVTASHLEQSSGKSAVPQVTTLKVPFCPNCKDRMTGTFCYRCGSSLVEGIRACECGNSDIWPHEKFCCKCGKPSPALPVAQKTADVMKKFDVLVASLKGSEL